MFVICQTVEATVRTLRLLLGDRENVIITSRHRDALNYVRDNEPILGRTVAILSNNYQSELVDGSILSLGIKGMRQDAWCLVFTSERPALHGVDGWIDKLDPNLPIDAIRQLVDAGTDDPELIPDLDALFARFPWIQRPVR